MVDTFADAAEGAAVSLRAINDGGFEGTEGETYRDIVNASFPSHLQTTSEAHQGVGTAINQYAGAFTTAMAAMATLRTRATAIHATVNATGAEVDAAEVAAATAHETATTATAASVAMPAAAPAAVAAHAAAAAADAELVKAVAENQAAFELWNGAIVESEGIKTELGAEVTAAVTIIEAQAKKRFEKNPSRWERAKNAVSNFLDKFADLLKNLSDLLQTLGGFMMLFPGLQLIGAIMLGVGLALKGILALNGNVSWTEFGVDALFALPGGALLRGARAGKLGVTGSRAAAGVERTAGKAPSVVRAQAKDADDVAALTRGERCTSAAEPVDMATGAMVDFEVDVNIPGVLPLVVDRNANSAHELGRALGPTWVSRMDVRIEVCADQVLMVSPDGALLTFPSVPLDGSEVACDGRPWLLSFVDGAYRVRDVAGGVTWVFAVTGERAAVRTVLAAEPATVADAEVADGAAAEAAALVDDLDRELAALCGAGIPGSSLAGVTDTGIEIGLTSLVQRTGHWVDYDYDPVTATMTRMRRSDGTVLDITWDRGIQRVVSLWVSNEDTHPGESPVRLMTYEYDMAGRLIRLINSSRHSLHYHYDDVGRPNGWTDRNGVSYFYVFDDAGRVITQVGTAGMFANALVYLPDEAPDAPDGGQVCVLVETAGEFACDPGTNPLVLGDGPGRSLIAERLARIEELPLVAALRSGGLAAAGLTGQGRDDDRDAGEFMVPTDWTRDEVLGDIRARVFRSTPRGDVWRIVEPSGVCVDYVHDDHHRVVSTIGPDGSVTSRSFDEYGSVTETVFPDGSTESVEPGAWGVPAKVIGRDGAVTEVTADAAGQVTEVTGPDGLTTTMGYEWRATGSVPVSVTGPDGLTSMVESDGAGRMVASTDPAGRRTSVTRDAVGRVVETMDPTGAVESTKYSPEGWPYQVIHADGTMRSARYDGEGNLVCVTDELGNTSTTQFTVFDKPWVYTDATGAETRLVYNTQLEPVGVVNADGHVWSFTRDLDGRVVAERDYNGMVTRFESDPARRWSKSVDAVGNETVTWVNVLGQPVRQFSVDGEVTWAYDEADRLVSVSSPEAVIDYGRDGLGRVTGESVEFIDPVTGVLTGERSAVDYEIDGLARVTAKSVSLPDGRRVSEDYARDEFGAVSGMRVSLHDRVAAAVDTAADGWGRQAPGSAAVTPAQVPAMSRVLAQLGLHVDGAGRRDRVDFAGAGAGSGIDGGGTAVAPVTSLVRQFKFDARGRLDGDRVVSLVGRDPVTGAPAAQVVTGREYSWRADSVITGISDVLAGQVNYGVDAVGRVTSVTRNADRMSGSGAGMATGSVTESYGWSTAGLLTSVDPGADFRDMDPAGSAAGVGVAQARPSARPGSGAGGRSGVSGAADSAAVGVELDGTLVTRSGRTRYFYDGAGRVVRTVTTRLSRKALVREFGYGAGGQVRTFVSSDDPAHRWVYSYDGLARRVAKSKIVVATGEIVHRVVFVHDGDRLVAEQTVIDEFGTGVGAASCGVSGRVWVTDPGTGESLGQIELGAYSAASAPQAVVDATFFALVADLADAPRELVALDSGEVAGRVSQSLYGRRTWRGTVSSPLLFAGQYEDTESGWAYNRFRFYDPVAGVYGAQDPLGVGPKIATAQGYVDHPSEMFDPLGRKVCAKERIMSVADEAFSGRNMSEVGKYRKDLPQMKASESIRGKDGWRADIEPAYSAERPGNLHFQKQGQDHKYVWLPEDRMLVTHESLKRGHLRRSLPQNIVESLPDLPTTN